MSLQTILIIVGCAILFILILFFVFVSIRKKKQNKTLDENLKKIQQENKDFDKDDAELVISNDEETAKAEDYQPEEEVKEEKPAVTPVIEDYVENDDPDVDFEREFKKLRKRRLGDDFLDMTSKGKNTKKDSIKEFEDFLDQHSYTRRILDKDMISNIKGLSPEMRQALLNKLFNKVDD